ncbi:MAG: hypothetical protein ACKVYV_03755 [Limisphaerales bacterium]
MKTPRTAAGDAALNPPARRERMERFGAFTALLQSVATLVLLPIITRQQGRRAGVAASWGIAAGASRMLRAVGGRQEEPGGSPGR